MHTSCTWQHSTSTFIHQRINQACLVALEPPTLATVTGADSKSPHAATLVQSAFQLRAAEGNVPFRASEQNQALERAYLVGL